MKRWICTACGAVERLTYYPDCCSSCGGAMVCDDGRTTSAANDDDPADHYDQLQRSYDEEARVPSAVVARWMRGDPLTADQSRILADLSLFNRVEQMQHLGRAA